MRVVRPLHGIRVLDLTRVLAGPFAGRMLSDLGAEVVKLEPPEGDVTRHFGHRRGEQTGYYAQQNAGKLNVSVDLRADGGPDLVRRLAAVADIVIENFRPGVLASFELDWASLSTDHPELIMCSISGFGQEGPESQRAAYAGIIHAESGFLARQADFAGGPASDTRLSIADTNAGLHGLVGVLSALRVRDLTGVGQHIDIAMIDAFLGTDDYAHWALDEIEVGGGAGEIWPTCDGPVIIMGDFRWVWLCATEHLGLQDPTPPGASLEEKIGARRKAWGDYVLSFDAIELFLGALDRANLAWGRVNASGSAFDSPTVTHRDTVVSIDDRVGGERRIVQSPYRFSHSDSGVKGPAPLLGEHNEQVLKDWLRVTPGEFSELIESSILIAEKELRS